MPFPGPEVALTPVRDRCVLRRLFRRVGLWRYPLLAAGTFALAVLLLAMQAELLESLRVLQTAIGLVGFGGAALIAGWGLIRAIIHLARLPIRSVGPLGALGGFIFTLTSLSIMALGALSAMFATFGFSRGRQLRRGGRVLLPPVRSGKDWAKGATRFEISRPAPAGLADQWRANGRTEHASVAAFARLSLDLMALGAPPELLADANLDALDEIRHTEACFALAAALDGQSQSPGAFPEAQHVSTLPSGRSRALAHLAITSLVDGALHEGVSARVIARLARRCEDPSIARMLRQLAADEGRHAAHGWDVVEWCLEQGGSEVAHALSGAIRMLPKQMHSSLPPSAADGAWEAWGIAGRGLEQEEYNAMRLNVIARTRARVAATLNGDRNAA